MTSKLCEKILLTLYNAASRNYNYFVYNINDNWMRKISLNSYGWIFRIWYKFDQKWNLRVDHLITHLILIILIPYKVLSQVADWG